MDESYKIQLKNNTNNSEVFEKNKDHILEVVDYILESLDFHVNIDIVVDDLTKRNHLSTSEVLDGSMTVKKNNYIVYLSIDVLKNVENDNGLDLDVTLFHEFGHIYDHYHVTHSKYYHKNPMKVKQKNFYDFGVSIGWNFWTEFHAYYFQFKEFRKYINYPTLLSLVKEFKTLQSDLAKIKEDLKNIKSVKKLDLQPYISRVKFFSYEIARFMAASSGGKRKYYEYSDKTTNTPEFNQFCTIYDGLVTRILKLFTNTYGKGMQTKLFNIGDWIIRKLYIPLCIEPIKHKGHPKLAFVLYKQ